MQNGDTRDVPDCFVTACFLRLRSLIERIERLLEDRAAVNNDIREVYAEGKAAGFDVKIMRQLIRLRQMEEADRDAQETLLDLYRRAVGMNTSLGQ